MYVCMYVVLGNIGSERRAFVSVCESRNSEGTIAACEHVLENETRMYTQ